MSTNRQKSFTATIGTPGMSLHFLNLLHGEKTLVTDTLGSGGMFTGRPQQRDHSHFVGLRSGAEVEARSRLQLYFRYTGRDYQLYIRTLGPYFGKCLSISETGLLGAFPSQGAVTFNLLGKGRNILTLDAISDDNPEVYIQVRDSWLLHKYKTQNSKYTYIADKNETPLLFSLMIDQRNAPYLDSPNEI
ncbi:hypothetical protein [Pseudomonas violetae]|jgi:hypothetical protein|uniref:Uncharacterized protein n=1 Tax=Pseudomonas violetae TaxID=2915813 RepID=A0ABT0F3Q1_9PSED|nr:hypothetical protein [Pseudomonas violetae]MCK1792494.1 hypothetical protein [Pseudomonas violetae]